MPAKAAAVAFLYRLGSGGRRRIAELLQENDGLCRCKDFHLRPLCHHEADRRGVVGLHVVHHEIIERAACQHRLRIFHELTPHRPVRRIEKHRFLIQKQIAVIGYAVRKRMNIFKLREAMIARPFPIQIVRHFTVTIHSFSSRLLLRYDFSIPPCKCEVGTHTIFRFCTAKYPPLNARGRECLLILYQHYSCFTDTDCL